MCRVVAVTETFYKKIHKKAIFSSKIETSSMDNLYLKPKTETFTEQIHSRSYVILCEFNSILFKFKNIIAGSFRVSLFIDFGCPEDLGTGPWHFYDIRRAQNCSVWNRLVSPSACPEHVLGDINQWLYFISGAI